MVVFGPAGASSAGRAGDLLILFACYLESL